MKRCLLAALAVLLVAACADQTPTSPTSLTPRDARATSSLADDPKIWFEVTGFTYGPNFEEIHVHTCKKGYEDGGTEYYTWPYYDANLDRTIPIFVVTNRSPAEVCSALSRSYSDVYTGGTISIAGSSDGGGVSLGSTPARWDVIKTVSDFPAGGDVILTAYPQDGSCPNPRFEQWILDNNWGSPRYGNPLRISGYEIANRRVSAEFFCREDPPPPPPDDGDDPPYCDDPTTCEGGGNSLSSAATVTVPSHRKPSRLTRGKRIF
jgi:hypothetical protein